MLLVCSEDKSVVFEAIVAAVVQDHREALEELKRGETIKLDEAMKKLL